MDGNTVAATAVIDRRLHELELAIYGREKSDIDGLLQRVAKQEKAIEAFKVALRAIVFSVKVILLIIVSYGMYKVPATMTVLPADMVKLGCTFDHPAGIVKSLPPKSSLVMPPFTPQTNKAK